MPARSNGLLDTVIAPTGFQVVVPGPCHRDDTDRDAKENQASRQNTLRGEMRVLDTEAKHHAKPSHGEAQEAEAQWTP